ncbi:MAG: ParB/RepB/Spo0J family partition protein [Acidobacteriales bacterium]|nr:ParB/RepB/Spo0J family partition protein [Terriglobales bacterium]
MAVDNVEKGAERRKALGRGLDSLLPSRPKVAEAVQAAAPTVVSSGEAAERPAEEVSEIIPSISAAAERRRGDEILQIPLGEIDKNPYQTRYRPEYENTDRPESVGALAASITVNGVLQPITVRPGKNGRYVLVMGERRCTAARQAGLTTIPAIVRAVSDQQAAEMTIVENLHRHDLNCIEQALAFFKLSERFGLTQEQIAKRVGASRETVANHLRLLKLPEKTMDYLVKGQLSFSHARVLLMLEDQQQLERVADLAVQKHWSVIILEKFVFDMNMAPPPPEARWAEPPMQGPGAKQVDPNVRSAQRELERILGLKVRIRDRHGKGKIVLEYRTLEDFDRVVGMFKESRQ